MSDSTPGTDVVEHVRPATSDLAIAPGQTHFTPAQLSALRALGAEDAPEGDVALLFHQSVRQGLDPFARQIYLIGRDERKNINGRWQTVGKKWTIQTGIDGYRVIRDRTGLYDGGDLDWCGPDGQWVDVWTKREAPFAARFRVYVKGRSRPEVGVAYFHEYAQTDRDGNPQAMWKTRPAGQLAKCAEALGLRKAFPQDLAGTYIDEEMQQADNVRDVTPRPAADADDFDPDAWAQAIDDADAPTDRQDARERLRRLYIEANPRHANVLHRTLDDGGQTIADIITARVKRIDAQLAQDTAEEPQEPAGPADGDGEPYDPDELL